MDLNRKQIESVEQSPIEPSWDVSARMFDRISPRYDLLNRLLSGRRDVAWRRKLAQHLPNKPDVRLLDVATGTGDVLLTILRERDDATGIGLDPSTQMLSLSAGKIVSENLSNRAILIRGDALALPFPDNSFDVVTIAFGIRNITDVPVALVEMRRVLVAGGRLLVLEFSIPANVLFRQFYLMYFRHFLPRIGRIISGDRAAYEYLNRSVESFPYGKKFCTLMKETGFTRVSAEPQTMGIATIYCGYKE